MFPLTQKHSANPARAQHLRIDFTVYRLIITYNRVFVKRGMRHICKFSRVLFTDEGKERRESSGYRVELRLKRVSEHYVVTSS